MKTLLLFLLSFNLYSQVQIQVESHTFLVKGETISHSYFGKATIASGTATLELRMEDIVTIFIVDKRVKTRHLIRQNGIYDLQFESSNKPLIIFTDNQGNLLYWQI